MKKTLSILLILTLAASLCACGAEKTVPAPAATEAPTAAAPAATEAPAPKEDGQNPVMNFVGPYSAGRPQLTVEAEGTSGALLTVRWGSSAWENTEWVMHADFDADKLIAEYRSGVKTDYVFQDNGSVKSETKQYEDGTGRFIFHEGDPLTITWEDDKENAGKDLVFAWSFEPGDPEEFIDPLAYVGTWVYERATLEVAQVTEEDYKVCVSWGSSAWERSFWEYDCYFDGTALCSFETGTRYDLRFAEDGSVAESKLAFSDGATRLELLEDGRLKWFDYKEYPTAGEYDFKRAEFEGREAQAENFVNEYFTVVGGYHPGVAGASLAKAKIACETLRFAWYYRLWCAVVPILRDEMLTGWERMTDDQRRDFDEAFLDVAELIDDCIEDWEANRGLFEDAGVELDMEALLRDPMARIAWDRLMSNTLTMGNSEN